MSKEKWINLYELADELYELKPWEYSYDDKLLCYADVNNNTMSYASAMGKGGNIKGLLIFNEKQINNYLFMIKNEISPYQLLNYQEGYFISYINKKDMRADEKIIPTKYNIYFKDIAICFHKYIKGYFPMQLNDEDLDILLNLIPQYIYLLRHLNKKEIGFSNDSSKMITRYYDVSLKGYKNAEIEVILPELNSENYHISQEEIDKLKGMKNNELEVEIEFDKYLPISSGDSYENDTYKIPRYFIIADKTNSKILSFNIENDTNNVTNIEYYKNSVNEIINLFKAIGIPKKIIVRDNNMRNILKDFINYTKKGIETNSNLDVIDKYFEMFFTKQKNNLKKNN